MKKNEKSNNDFTIIFNQIENFNSNNPSFSECGINTEDIKNDQTIREFSNICRELNSDTNIDVIYNTFS